MLDKIIAVTEGEKLLSSFTYHMDGQIASATRADGRRESDLWDGAVRRPAAVAGTLREPVPQSPGGLMIHRNGTEFTNEPAVTGGNPVLAGGKVLFNDLLGNTLGAKDENAYPLGAPDGWNNLAYVNNSVTMVIDWLDGQETVVCTWDTILSVSRTATYDFGAIEVSCYDPITYTY